MIIKNNDYFGGGVGNSVSRLTSAPTNMTTRLSSVSSRDAHVDTVFGTAKTTTKATPAQTPTNVVGNSGGGGGDFEPNVLSDFAQVAYNFRFYTNGDKPGSGKEIVIAETGVTGFNIKEVTVKSLVSPSPQYRNTAFTEVQIVILDPLGTSFMDAMYEAQVENRVDNWQKAYYWLDLTFVGYREDGEIVTNLCQDMPGGGVWTWQLNILDIATHFDVSGCTYTLTCMPTNDIATANETYRTIQEAYSIQATTVQEYFKQLAEKLNQTIQLKHHGTPLYTYDFQFHPLGDADPGAYPISTQNMDESMHNRSYGPSDETRNIPTSNIPKGTIIHDHVAGVLSTATEAQGLIESNDEGSIVWNVYPQVTYNGKFDPTTNQYLMDIVYHVKGYRTHKIMNKTDANGQAALESIQGWGGLKKQYDYVFTGLNTEVVDFDIKYNFAWNAVLPRFEGVFYYHDNIEVHATMNKDARNQMEAYKQKVSQIQEAQKTLVEAPQARKQILAATPGRGMAEAQHENDRAAKARSDLIKLTGGAIQDYNAAKEALYAGVEDRISGDKGYAEDLVGGTNPTPVSIAQVAEGPRYSAGTGLPGQWNPGRSIYGAMLDQMYDAHALMEINLSIKGDPYWLGAPIIEQVQGSASGVNYTVGDTCFSIVFRYPYRIGEDGAPELRDNDIFSGIYLATEVTHSFVNGEFKQTIKALRQPKIPPKYAIDMSGKSTPVSDGGILV